LNISRFTKFAIYILFFLSGITGLVYEVTWTRMLTTVFGSTTYAISSVLTAFMGGLAIGSYVIGRYIENKKNQILIYAFLEAGIGLTAFLLPVVFSALDSLYPIIYEHTTSHVWFLVFSKVVLSLLVLFVPTFLMGGTLPVLCKLFIKSPKESGRQVAILYAINTIGAAIGSFITGFFLIEFLGISKTIQVVAIINFILAIAFFILNFYYKKSEYDIKKTASTTMTSKQEKKSLSNEKFHPYYSILLLLGFALAGFISLSYEVLWTRLLVFKLKMTVYAFSIMLTTFLVGIGIGSVVVAIIEKFNLIKNHSKVFGIVQILVGLAGLSTIILFSQIDSYPIFDIVGFFKSTLSWKKLIFTEILLSAMIMLVPTILMGMTFPLISRIFTQNVKVVGKTIGTIYAINTVGCILGSFFTGFFLVKIFGTQKTIVLISLIALIIGTAIVVFNSQGIKRPKKTQKISIVFLIVMWLIALSVILWLPKDLLFNYYNIYEEQAFKDTKIIYANEGIECVTTVHQYPGGYRGISTSSVNVAGTHYTHRTTQKLQAHIPMLIHPNPKEVLQIGFGSGETSHIVTTYDIKQLDLVDISKEVIETSTKYFNDINKNVASNHKFNPIIMDGANYIYLTKKKYDLILNDASWPGYTGCSALYSKDYFENAKKRLKKGGIMTSWFPIVEGEEFRILLKTFHSVFPHVSIWLSMTHVNKHALIVGSLEKIEIDCVKFMKRFKQYAQADLKSVDLDNPLYFLDTYIMDETVFDSLLQSTPIHTLNHPILEFLERKKDLVGNISALKIITKNNVSIIPHLTNYKEVFIEGETLLNALESTRKATNLVIQGNIHVISTGEYKPRFESEFKKALKIDPKHPGANNFFFRMFNLHFKMAKSYAKDNNKKYAAYCYKLIFNEINFYIALKSDLVKGYYNRGLIYLNGYNYLGLTRIESLKKGKDDFYKALSLNPNQTIRNDINLLLGRINSFKAKFEKKKEH